MIAHHLWHGVVGAALIAAGRCRRPIHVAACVAVTWVGLRQTHRYHHPKGVA